ncbi:MAG: hypothetical protein HeimC3_00530 [Candidatus Heimdallarchaeota archaeon LC_3]|nr:MAG: hypothetical protein HeimC3_00530 [Candidatus Heimdallarchaeota archaeon LC_3]
MIDIVSEILLPFLLVIIFVLFWLILSEFLSRTNKLSKPDARKVLHIMVGNVVIFIPFFGDKLIVTLIPLGFIVFNFFLTPYGPIKKLRMDTFESGHGLGTVWYAISLTLLVFFSYDNSWMILVSFFPLAYGDGLAAVIGSRAKKGFFWSFGGKKSLIGTWTFIWASFIAVSFGLMLFNFLSITNFSMELIILIGITVAVIASLIEFLSPKGMDNLFIPVGVLIFLQIMETPLITYSVNISLTVFVIGTIFALSFGIIGYKVKFLSFDGALAGFFMGMIIMGMGGYTLGIGLLIFFLIGSLVTKINKKPQIGDIFEKGSVKRDSSQAIAKAGFATFMAPLLVFFDYHPLILMMFIASLGTSLTDTVATEVGIYTQSQPRHVLRPWKIVQPGESGGVSLKGTLAGSVTAILFSVILFLGLAIDPSIPMQLPEIALILIPIASIVGMFVDSILGITIQEQRKCSVCKRKVEILNHCNQETEKFFGLSFIKNDTVNFLAVSIGGLSMILLSIPFLPF